MIDILALQLRTRPLASFSVIAFVFVIMGLYFPVEPLLFIALLIGIMLIFLNFIGKINVFLTFFIFMAAIVGIVFTGSAVTNNDILINRFDNKNVRVAGTVATIPEVGYYGKSFYVNTDRIYDIRGTYDKQIKILVNNARVRNIKLGECIVFNAVLKSVESENVKFANHYLAKGASLVADDFILLRVSAASGYKKLIFSLRNYIISVADKLFDGEARMLFKALTAGDRSTFSDDLSWNLRASGLSHIACVSGMHVTILGMAVYNLLKKRKKITAVAVSLCVVYLFAFVTGLSPSTFRAALMFTSYMVAKAVVRENDSFTALCMSALVLALINPFVIYDWGFILSFLSVLGIEVFSPDIKRLLSFLPDMLSDSVAVTVSAQLATLPVSINMFGYISLYSVFANVVVSSFFLVTLYLCFAVLVVSLVPFAGNFFATVCTLFLDTVCVVANFFADLPASVVPMDSFDIFELIVYYVLVVIFAFRKHISMWMMCAGMLLCAAVLGISTIWT